MRRAPKEQKERKEQKLQKVRKKKKLPNGQWVWVEEWVEEWGSGRAASFLEEGAACGRCSHLTLMSK